MTKRLLLQAETHIHDMSPFHFLAKLNAAGLANYPSRAMVCAGTTVTGVDSPDCMRDLHENHLHLRRVGIGTDDLIPVPGDNVMLGLLEDAGQLRRVRLSIEKRDRPLRLYMPRGMDPLLQRLGLTWDDTCSPDWSIAEHFDNKLLVRHLGATLSCDGFAPWRFITEHDRHQLKTRRAEVLAEAELTLATDVVFLKRPDYDGGEGIFQWNPDTDLRTLQAFCDEHLHHGLLMEAGYPAPKFSMMETSVQVEMTEDGWDPIYSSLQITHNNAHDGNEVVIGEHLIAPPVWRRMRELMKPLCEHAVARGFGRKRPKLMGFDFLIVKSGGQAHAFIIEINARGTAPQYAYAVASQVAPRIGDRAAVVMENLPVSPKRDHQGLEHQLKELLWDGKSTSGVLIGNAGCISHGKVMMYCIGQTLEEARHMRRRLPPL